MTGNFNVRDSIWDNLYFFHLIHSDTIFDITNSFDICLSSSLQQAPMRYSDNDQIANSAINLMFLQPNSIEFDNYSIHLDLHHPSNHTLLTVDISIEKIFLQEKQYTITSGSEEEEKFITDCIKIVGDLDTVVISNKNILKGLIYEYVTMSELILLKHSRNIRISRRSKEW